MAKQNSSGIAAVKERANKALGIIEELLKSAKADEDGEVGAKGKSVSTSDRMREIQAEISHLEAQIAALKGEIGAAQSIANRAAATASQVSKTMQHATDTANKAFGAANHALDVANKALGMAGSGTYRPADHNKDS